MSAERSIFPSKLASAVVVVIFLAFGGTVAILLAVLECQFQKSVQKIAMPERPDFSAFELVDDKKHAFFEYIGTLADIENQRVLHQRATILSLQEALEQNGILNRRQTKKLSSLLNEYEVGIDLAPNKQISKLMRRVNVIPKALVQVQAAIESGWGTSRFAVDGHNLFGQWCFAKGCGIVPANRAPGRTHEVARFSSDLESIKAYMNNLNSFDAYTRFRSVRAQLDPEAMPRSGVKLAATLLKYSERGQEYVHELQGMIRREKLEPVVP